MKIPILIIKLLVLGALFLISNQNLHLGVSSEREIFFNAYLGWVNNIFHQAVDITGYVVKFEWLPSG
jgi:hypothetical protein